MELNELKHKEEELRKCFEKALNSLDVGGTVSHDEAKRVLMYGGLWHHANMLLKEHMLSEYGTERSSEDDDTHKHGHKDDVPLHASGLKVAK